MSIQEVSPEHLAQLFHHYHRALAQDFGCHSTSTPEAWERIPREEKGRMVAAARLALLELSTENRREGSRCYFAKPGKAEWGC